MGLTTEANRNIKKVKDEIQEKYTDLHKRIMRDDYWEGEGAKALKEKYYKMKQEMDKQKVKLEELINNYNSLQAAVDRAESERQRKISELRIKASRAYARNR